jgi:hypothetical protein
MLFFFHLFFISLSFFRRTQFQQGSGIQIFTTPTHGKVQVRRGRSTGAAA